MNSAAYDVAAELRVGLCGRGPFPTGGRAQLARAPVAFNLEFLPQPSGCAAPFAVCAQAQCAVHGTVGQPGCYSRLPIALSGPSELSVSLRLVGASVPEHLMPSPLPELTLGKNIPAEWVSTEIPQSLLSSST